MEEVIYRAGFLRELLIPVGLYAVRRSRAHIFSPTSGLARLKCKVHAANLLLLDNKKGDTSKDEWLNKQVLGEEGDKCHGDCWDCDRRLEG